jgi:hypothetical protein
MVPPHGLLAPDSNRGPNSSSNRKVIQAAATRMYGGINTIDKLVAEFHNMRRENIAGLGNSGRSIHDRLVAKQASIQRSVNTLADNSRIKDEIFNYLNAQPSRGFVTDERPQLTEKANRSIIRARTCLATDV